MKLRWFVPLAVLLPLRLNASEPIVAARVATIVINPSQITPLHLRPEFETAIRMPEEVTSVILGSPGSFKAEHNEGEPDYVYVKPITKERAQSNLLIATKSGQHVTLELISDGAASSESMQPVDFLIEYRASRSFLIASDISVLSNTKPTGTPAEQTPRLDTSAAHLRLASASASGLDEEYEQQARINAPAWTKWTGKHIETSIGDVRQWSNQTAVSYSVYNNSEQPVEIVPPQIQITGRKLKKKKKDGKGITSDQLQIRDYRLNTTSCRLRPAQLQAIHGEVVPADRTGRPGRSTHPDSPAIHSAHRRR